MRFLLPTLFISVGVMLLFVKADPEQLREKIHTSPQLALYRVRLFRYAVSIALVILGVVAYLTFSDA